MSGFRRGAVRVGHVGALAAVAALALAAVPESMSAQHLSERRSAPPVLSFRVLACHPHDPEAFTQGLVYRDGALLESTGLNGRSTVRRVQIETGRVVHKRDVSRRYFAEGLTELSGELFQLTWESGVAFVYDAQTFALRRTMTYRGEGWGLTHDGSHLILSDGSETLQFLEPHSFEVVRTLVVREGSHPITRLNELEFVQGHLLANVWLTDRIAVIDVATGEVAAWLDLSALEPRPRGRPANAVLNGTAYDPVGNRLFVTGKLWPTLFEIEVLWENVESPRSVVKLGRGPERGCA